jgi:hypothetical protein
VKASGNFQCLYAEQTLIDRRVLLQAEFVLSVVSTIPQVTYAAGPPVVYATNYTAPPNGCGYGSLASLAPFPLHQLMTVASATINNNTVN